jgi:TDG/mug DNA glycosylase family protein
MQMPPKPSKAELLAAKDKLTPDMLDFGLKIVFCGINPGLYTAYYGFHFAGPSNRFWPTLHAAGFTERRLLPSEQHSLLRLGYGFTNMVARASSKADELSAAEIERGGEILREKILHYQPKVLAILGIGTYRKAFADPKAQLGLQERTIGSTKIWVLPNPSGLNAHYTPARMAELFTELRLFAESLA